MRVMLAAVAAALALVGPGLAAQDEDRAAELRQRIERALGEETRRVRTELLEFVREELGRPAADPAAALARAQGLITAELLRGHVEYLASDELEGRQAGYPGCEKAAEYIAGVFKESGLKPVGDGGTYFQKFRIGGRETKNCLGLIEGSDPELKKEIVVVGAHHDHVGTADQVPDHGRLGRPRDGDRIWNGADDNASGTSAVLALARAFGETGLRGRRSILLMTFSAEEAGLVGSAYYTRHPIAPLSQHVFMLNLDMVGRNPDRPVEIHGVGSAEGGVLRRAFEHAVRETGLRARLNDQVALLGGDSDHSSFADRRIPFTFFFTGFHPDYHRVTDHADKIAYDRLAQVARTALVGILEIANAEERPRFAELARRRLPLPDPGEAFRPVRVLGVNVADLDEEEYARLGLPEGAGGLQVREVRAGGAAEAAGVRVGDVLVAIDGVPLPRADARGRLREVLNTRVRPGRDVEVVVLRDGRRETLKARWDE